MTAAEFAVEDWIDRLVPALSKLAEAQKSYLQEYYIRNAGVRLELDMRHGNRPPFPLDDVRMLYAMAYHSHVLGEEEYYAPLCAVLDPVRIILRSHPTLARVSSQIIGRDEFWMEILHSGHAASPTGLIAGLMARAAELSGDCFRTAAGELNTFLTPAAESGVDGVPGGLDVGYDAVLFYGLTVKERIDVVNGMAILPFEQVRAFVDQSFVEDLAPSRAAFRNWRSVGAVVRPFRWRPLLRRTGYLGELKLRNLGPFSGMHKPSWNFLLWRTRHRCYPLQRWAIASTVPPAGSLDWRGIAVANTATVPQKGSMGSRSVQTLLPGL